MEGRSSTDSLTVTHVPSSHTTRCLTILYLWDRMILHIMTLCIVVYHKENNYMYSKGGKVCM